MECQTIKNGDLVEVWKPVVGAEDKYMVSNLGNVKSLMRKVISDGHLKTVPEKMLSLCKGTNYLTVRLRSFRGRCELVHRLVAEAFIPNPQNKPQVNHIDGNKLNNKVNNLEWVTFSGNNKHAFRTGLKSTLGEKHTRHKLTSQQVIEIRNKRGLYSQVELAEKYNVSRANISAIQTRRSWYCINENGKS